MLYFLFIGGPKMGRKSLRQMEIEVNMLRYLATTLTKDADRLEGLMKKQTVAEVHAMLKPATKAKKPVNKTAKKATTKKPVKTAPKTNAKKKV